MIKAPPKSKLKPKPAANVCLTPLKRITKTSWKNPLYNAEFCEVIQDMYARGETDVEIAVNLGVSRETFYMWIRTEPEFATAVRAGKAASHAYWTKLGKRGAEGDQKVNDKIWHLFMRNCHGWDKQNDVDIEPASKEQVNEIKVQMDALIAAHQRDV